MRNIQKKIVILTILLLTLISISAVNATNAMVNDTISDSVVHESTKNTLHKSYDNPEPIKENKGSFYDKDVVETVNSNYSTVTQKPLKSHKNNNIESYSFTSENEVTVTNYDDLSNAVNWFNTNKKSGNITLDGDRIYSVGGSKNIIINSSININGNGRTIQGFRSSPSSSSISITNLIHVLEGNTVNIFNLNFNDNIPTQWGTINNEGNLTLKNIGFTNSSGRNAIAIHNRGNLELNDSFFENIHYNSTTVGYTQGGAIHIQDGHVNIINCNFTNCSTIRYGGAISINNLDDDAGQPIVFINKCIFKNNFAENDGGAIRISITSDVTIDNCEFINNSAIYAGAILVDDSTLYPSYNINLLNNLFADNHADDVAGAIFIEYADNINITGNTFKNNYAEAVYGYGWAGACYIYKSKAILLNNILDGGHAVLADFLLNFNSIIESQNNQIFGFQSIDGVVLYNYGIFNSTNDTIKNCSNTYIVINDEDSELYIQNGTITNNSAIEGVIFNWGDATLSYNNISDNYVTDNDFYVIYNDNGTLNLDHNLFINNTIARTRDMLLNNDSGTFNVANNNIYIDNYLEDYWNVTTDTIDIVSNDETPIHVINLRDVYNNLIVNGTVYCYFKGSSEVFDTFDVKNGDALIKFVESPELPLGEHIFELEYKSLSKHYQDLLGTELRIELKINLKPEPINVTKVWIDTDTSKRQDVTINLYKDGEFNQTIILNDANNWKHTFEGLPKYLSDGTLIKYAIDEANVPEGYLKIITNNTLYNFTVTNIELKNINVNIEWNDDNNRDGLRPNNVTVTVYNNDAKEEVRSFNLTGPTWTHTFDLPKYNLEGNLINYTANNTIINYTTNVIDATNSLIIINTHIPETVTVNVTKIWDDNGDQDGLRPGNVTVVLHGVGDISVVLNEVNNWKHSFENLYKFNNGVLIDYTVSEDSIANYTASIVNDSYVFTITNSHEPEKVDYTVNINWEGNAERPDTVKLQLCANGVKIGLPITLSTKINQKYIFENLPKYKDGKLIKYAARLLDLPDGFSESLTQGQYKLVIKLQKSDSKITLKWAWKLVKIAQHKKQYKNNNTNKTTNKTHKITTNKTKLFKSIKTIKLTKHTNKYGKYNKCCNNHNKKSSKHKNKKYIESVTYKYRLYIYLYSKYMNGTMTYNDFVAILKTNNITIIENNWENGQIIIEYNDIKEVPETITIHDKKDRIPDSSSKINKTKAKNNVNSIDSSKTKNSKTSEFRNPNNNKPKYTNSVVDSDELEVSTK